MEEFSLRLQALLDRRGYTPFTLSKEMGVSRSLTWNWVRGNGYPDLYHLAQLVRILDTDANYLLFGKEI